MDLLGDKQTTNNKLKDIIKISKEYDKNKDGKLNWKDHKQNLKELEEQMNEWMPTNEMLMEWEESFNKTVDITNNETTKLEGGNNAMGGNNVMDGNNAIMGGLYDQYNKLTTELNWINGL